MKNTVKIQTRVGDKRHKISFCVSFLQIMDFVVLCLLLGYHCSKFLDFSTLFSYVSCLPFPVL